jgi:hypothetical protein
MYAVMLLLGTIAACITLSPGLQDVLKKVSYADISHSFFLDPRFKDCILIEAGHNKF